MEASAETLKWKVTNTKVGCQSKYKYQSRWWRMIWMSLKLLTNTENLREYRKENGCLKRFLTRVFSFLWVNKKAWKLSFSMDSADQMYWAICHQTSPHLSPKPNFQLGYSMLDWGFEGKILPVPQRKLNWISGKFPFEQRQQCTQYHNKSLSHFSCSTVFFSR